MQLLRALLCVLGLLLVHVAPVAAHDLGLAQIDVTRASQNTVILRAKLSATVAATQPDLPGDCTTSQGPPRSAPGGNQLVDWSVTCSDSLPRVLTLPWALHAGMIAFDGGTPRLVSAGPDGIPVDLGHQATQAAAFWPALTGYTGLGIEHILIGLDHIALLVCLALLASGWTLVRLATAFTIGHSLTLCLAALDMLRVPSKPMEAVIALSVVFLARDVLLKRRFGARHTALLTGIGLVHGLGFASVLNEVGLPGAARFSALLGFNLGVEIGQILVLVALVAGGVALARVIRIPAHAGGLAAGAFTGSIAGYWTLERIAALA